MYGENKFLQKKIIIIAKADHSVDSNCCFEIALYTVRMMLPPQKEKTKLMKTLLLVGTLGMIPSTRLSMDKNPLKISVDTSDIHVAMVLCVTPVMSL